MKILIIEDEPYAQKRLKSLIQELRPNARILDALDSIEDAVSFLENNPDPDLLFLDIQLSDGLSFEIFKETEVNTPVIFTTAFDEYAIKAFQVNSVDYLLKPVEVEALERAFQKFEKLHRDNGYLTNNLPAIQNLVSALTKKDYPKRFLIKSGQQLSYISRDEIAYFFSENSLSFLLTKTGKRYSIDYTLEDLQDLLHPDNFFRINRSLIVHIEAVDKVSPYFNNRLALKLKPKMDQQAIVSRERVKEFKGWLGA